MKSLRIPSALRSLPVAHPDDLQMNLRKRERFIVDVRVSEPNGFPISRGLSEP